MFDLGRICVICKQQKIGRYYGNRSGSPTCQNCYKKIRAAIKNAKPKQKKVYSMWGE